jgi:pyruvate-ferredoxin/flavodoxin oxidoreductase
VHGLDQQKLAVQSGHWPLFRHNPALAAQGKNPFVLESKAPTIPLEKYIYNETRYAMLKHSNPEVAQELLQEAQQDVNERWKTYENLAKAPVNGSAPTTKEPAKAEAVTSVKGVGE